ncbi:MAG: ATP-binding cassette domain-containing protein [Eggerthellaceae bacterium]|nr:ATP-binding cassette domain-containing protein [Eggerthellaceae bacterium]
MDILKFTDFTFAYPLGTPILKGIDWSVEKGSFILLTGSTGSGKTTLLRCAKPEIAPAGERSGSIEFEGQELAALSQNTRIGYVSQSPQSQIVCEGVLHELAFGLENIGTDPDTMRRRVAEIAHFFGIEAWMSQPTDELSGGQMQLLNLASVLVMQPDLVLLDEPTAQLDPVSAQTFLHALFRINREAGITVIVATQSPEIMSGYATGIVGLADGRINQLDLGDFRYRPIDPSGFPERHSAPAGKAFALKVRDGYFRYGNAMPWVLRDFEIEFEAGKIHSIVGANGCGKSTFLKVAAGMYRLDHGKLKNSLYSSMAYLPQDPNALFSRDSVYEEVSEWMTGDQSRPAVMKYLKAWGLADRASLHPYDLSGGERQKLALAKLLCLSPRLLLLDEPVKGLDAASKLEMADVLIACRDKGITIVMATHDLSFAWCISDDMIMLFDGGVASVQDPVSFLSGNLFYRPEEDGFAMLWKARENS